ncbi:hypothetical protein [Amycolatopsis sp.]|uniref:hypothetical protein n=1 Tax=Amycolatopsis sp. TaxID=37632 RepID=UPI002DFBF903|nr:hypothetical protein [Amycolatopsis sp.]
MSLADRVRDLLRRPKAPELSVDDPALVVVAEAFDPAEADSAVLARSPSWVSDRQAVLRHHLLLPAGRTAEAARVLAQDGYVLREVREEATDILVHVSRVQLLDALHCAQERSRMAGLAQRLGGEALGWDALQAPAPVFDPPA